jgi:hypothetical protein
VWAINAGKVTAEISDHAPGFVKDNNIRINQTGSIVL